MSSLPLSSVDGAKYIWRNIWDNRNSTHDDSNWCLWWYNIFDKCVIFWISREKIQNFGQETLYTFNLKCLLDPLVSYSTTYLVLGRRGIKINRDAHTFFTPDTYSRSSGRIPIRSQVSRETRSPRCVPLGRRPGGIWYRRPTHLSWLLSMRSSSGSTVISSWLSFSPHL